MSDKNHQKPYKQPSQNMNRKDRLKKNTKLQIHRSIKHNKTAFSQDFEACHSFLPCLNSSGMAFMGGTWPWELETCRFQNLGIFSSEKMFFSWVLSHEKQ
jgi:hypothetical protein